MKEAENGNVVGETGLRLGEGGCLDVKRTENMASIRDDIPPGQRPDIVGFAMIEVEKRHSGCRASSLGTFSLIVPWRFRA